MIYIKEQKNGMTSMIQNY